MSRSNSSELIKIVESNAEQLLPAVKEIIINGGISSPEEVISHLKKVDGVMIGRAAYHTPYMLADIEKEIFGNEQGVSADRLISPGKLHSAENGTLFLDEISNLSLEAQAKMLKLLRENTYSPVGGKRLMPCNVRVITATKKNLRSLVAQGLFREDLFLNWPTLFLVFQLLCLDLP